jgi:RNA polymerase sigma-70 factor (ECF subfamily)
MPSRDQLAELIHRVARERDRAAFRNLFGYFAPRVKAYLVRLGATSQTAEDLAQEAMLTLWRKAPLFDPDRASAATWVFTIARNLRIDALRRDRHPQPDFGDPSLAPDLEVDAVATLEARESGEALRLAMTALPPDQAEIVLLSFFADKPHSEIATDLNIPLGTVKSRLRLAMTRLRAALEGNT